MRTDIRYLLLTAALVLSSYSHSADKPAVTPQAELKTINYRGGIVVFSIPRNWREEYEPAGGATFYEDSPDSGTLRLNVLGFESENAPAKQMSATAFRTGTVESTLSGFPIRREEKEVEENGERLRIYRWEIAVPVEPRHLRVAIFSYTILANQESAPAIVADVALLDSCIRAASFSQQLGEVGEFKHQ